MTKFEEIIKADFGRKYDEYFQSDSDENPDGHENRSELEKAAYKGQKWKITLEVLGDFLTSLKLDAVSILSNKGYENETELKDILATLRMIQIFENLAVLHIGQGEEAEQELRNHNG